MKKNNSRFILGLVAGVLLLVLLRLLFMPEELVTHHHANMAIFLDGNRLNLSADKYMEDVEGCKPDYIPLKPEERTHFHANEDMVVHVHDEGVTWGHFLANVGFSLSDGVLVTDQGEIISDDGDRSLKFILNGELVDSLANRLIGSEDRVLISFGSENMETGLLDQLAEVAENAAYHNVHPDPGSCSGAIEASWGSKLRRAVWF